MKKVINKYLIAILIACFTFSVSSCNKFLDIEPESQITPNMYFKDASHLESYLIEFYDWLPTHPTDGGGGYGFYGVDDNTDNQTTLAVPALFQKHYKKVLANGSNWSFTKIYNINYFLDQTLNKWKDGEISGSEDMVNHLMGEAYFFRAFAYYEMLVKFGDFPIVKHTMPDQMDILLESAKRSPRNEVARFILSDLDSAAMLLAVNSPDGKNNRLSSSVAQLFKSRVALFEASWLTNFNGTAFVPNGPEWPGKTKEFTANYSFPTGSIEGEIKFFLNEAVKSSQIVADKFIPVMSKNTQIVPTPANEDNPYYFMFCDTDMSKYPEVMLWRAYNYGIKITNNVNETASNTSAALTRGMIKQFLDINGMPWYADNALWKNDDEMYEVRGEIKDAEGNNTGVGVRDNRAFLFIKEPGQDLMWRNSQPGNGGNGYNVEPWMPNVTDLRITGYAARKGMNPDRGLNYPLLGTVGSPVFRSAEALLNYIEASYMLTNNINSTAREYWEYLRQRAGIKANTIDATIAAIQMDKEALYDWGAYSAGKLIDPTMMAIRKERRSEYICESRRMEDLTRWRALDQLIDQPYHIEGMRLWNSNYYNNKLTEEERAIYRAGLDINNAVVSSIDDVTGTGDYNGENKGEYIKIHRVSDKNLSYNGTYWTLAHYLTPIEIEHFLITSPDLKDPNNSSLYQNPYWPLTPNEFATK